MSDAERTTAELLAALCDETISPDEMRQLDRLIIADAGVRRRYLEYLDLHARLSYGFHRPAEVGSGGQVSDSYADAPCAESLPTLSTTHYPLPTTFIGGPVFSYMVATVVLCLMLLGAWAYKISHVHDSSYVDNSRWSTPSGPHEFVFIGRITGMRDCRWVASDPGTFVGSAVSLGREYAVASGLLEITYKSGARVILEGPCEYKVDSDAGGYLERGKLTARVETKGSGFRVQGSEVRSQKSRPSSLIPHPSSLFSVRTPTAVVTDLGTEFGVEVDENGDTTSYVFEGKIVVKAGLRGFGDSGIRSSDKRPATAVAGVEERELEAKQSIRVSRVRETHHKSTTTMGGTGVASGTLLFTNPVSIPTFVRTLVRPIEQLDLLDIIAGGNGLGRRRERGLDPTTGMEDPIFVLGERTGDGKYHPVTWHRLIDGVFIPGKGPTQIDSTGGAFDGFSETTGRVWGSIWPRSAQVDPTSKRTGWIYDIQSDDRYMPEQLGIVGVCQNGGITFDLAAVRAQFKGARPARLHAVAGRGVRIGYEEPYDGRLDLWVIVDGETRWKRIGLRHRDGPVEIDVELSAADRFLTLAVTDGGDGGLCDWIVIGDPVLKFETIEKP